MLLKIWISLMLIPSVLFAADTESKPVSTEIEQVTVFLSGAQLFRKGNSVLVKGKNVITFTGLSSQIRANSIQVSAGSNATILSVTHQVNYMQQLKKPKDILMLEDSLISYQLKLDVNKELFGVYNHEREMVLANKSVKGENVNLNSEDLEDVADFYRDRLSQLALKRIELSETEKKIRNKMGEIQKQLQEKNAVANKPSGEIIVELNSTGAVKTPFELTYFVTGASWVPSYDLRAMNVTDPVNLSYKALVTQNTGVAWNDVKLVLSTGNPNISGNKPTVTPWRLNFVQPYTYQQRGQYALSNAGYPMAKQSEKLEAKEDKGGFLGARDGALQEIQISQQTGIGGGITSNNTNMEFEISVPYTVLSDGKSHQVHIQDIKLPSEYQYYAAPKFDNDAFLLARISGWAQYKLQSGSANIYFRGTYVGQSYINTSITEDTLDISLGRDKDIIIEREKVKDFCSQKVIGSNKKESLGIKISIKNKKSEKIILNLQDQVPISSNKEIEVEVMEISGASKNDQNGTLDWNIDLPASGSKSLIIQYSIKYPKDKNINL